MSSLRDGSYRSRGYDNGIGLLRGPEKFIGAPVFDVDGKFWCLLVWLSGNFPLVAPFVYLVGLAIRFVKFLKF